MKYTFRILLLLAPVLLAAQLCHADPLNGGIHTEDVVGMLLLILIGVLVFAAAPVVSYLSYKRPGRQLNLTAWVLAIITKLAFLILIARSGGNQYLLASILPNISIYLLLLKAERNLSGRKFQLSVFVRSILGISVVNILLSLLLFRLMFSGNFLMHGVVIGLARFGVTVWFVYRYLKSAEARGVTSAPGLLHAFVFGLATTVVLYISSKVMLLMVFVQWKPHNLSGITNISFSMPVENVYLGASASLSGAVAYWLFNQKMKNVG